MRWWSPEASRPAPVQRPMELSTPERCRRCCSCVASLSPSPLARLTPPPCQPSSHRASQPIPHCSHSFITPLPCVVPLTSPGPSCNTEPGRPREHRLRPRPWHAGEGPCKRGAHAPPPSSQPFPRSAQGVGDWVGGPRLARPRVLEQQRLGGLARAPQIPNVGLKILGLPAAIEGEEKRGLECVWLRVQACCAPCPSSGAEQRHARHMQAGTRCKQQAPRPLTAAAPQTGPGSGRARPRAGRQGESA